MANEVNSYSDQIMWVFLITAFTRNKMGNYQSLNDVKQKNDIIHTYNAHSHITHIYNIHTHTYIIHITHTHKITLAPVWKTD